MKTSAAVAPDADGVHECLARFRRARDRGRQAAAPRGRGDPIGIDELSFEAVSREDLHRGLSRDFDAFSTAEQLVVRQIVADHGRLTSYQSTLARMLDEGKADLRVLERLEGLREKASDSFFRGLDALRALKVATTPIVVQAAAKDHGHVDAHPGRRSRPVRPGRPIRLREARG